MFKSARLALILALMALPAAAMVSPYYDSVAKIRAIMASPEVADAVLQAPIGSVSNIGTADNGNDLWMVRVQECDLTVELLPEYPPDGESGATVYTVKLTGPCG